MPPLSTAQILMAGYGRWKQNNPKGTYSDYWWQVNKSYDVDPYTGEWHEVNKYRNRASAGRAFRKVTRGQTSGTRIGKELYATGKQPVGERRTRRGPTGAWQVIIRFLNYNDEGQLVQCVAENGEDCIISFPAYSFEYTTIADIPNFEEKLAPLIEEKVSGMISEEANGYNTYCGVTCATYRVEIYPIETSKSRQEAYVIEDLEE